MAGNIFSYTLMMRNKAKSATNSLRKEMGNTSKAGTSAFSNIGKSVKAMRVNMGSLLGQFISLKALIIATFAVKLGQKFAGMIGKIIEKANIQQKSIVTLNEGLASYGNFTKEASFEMQQLSDDLQKQTAFADDLINSQMGLLATYGMEKDAIKKVMPLVLDFATAKQVDLKTATDLVGKAFVGYTGTLSRYGIILDKTMSQQEKFNEFIKILGQFQGTAAAHAKTYAGQIKNLGNTFGDMQEPLGFIMQDTIAQSGILVQLTKNFEDARVWLNKFGDSAIEVSTKAVRVLWKDLLNIGSTMVNLATSDSMIIFAKITVTALGTIKDAVKIVSNAFSSMHSEIVDVTTIGMLTAIAAWEGEVKGRKDVDEEIMKNVHVLIDDLNSSFINSIVSMSDNHEKIIEGMGDKWKGLGKTIKDSLGGTDQDLRSKWLEGVKENIKETDGLADSIMNLTENRNAYNSELVKTITLTKQESQQFALATKLEQEQTKFLLGKLSGASIGTIGSLSDQEKKLIGRQKILQRAGADSFSAFTSFQTGIQSDVTKKESTNIMIDLTDDAKKLIRAEVLDYEKNRQERQAANAG